MCRTRDNSQHNSPLLLCFEYFVSRLDGRWMRVEKCQHPVIVSHLAPQVAAVSRSGFAVLEVRIRALYAMVEEIKQEMHVDMRTWSKAWNGMGLGGRRTVVNP